MSNNIVLGAAAVAALASGAYVYDQNQKQKVSYQIREAEKQMPSGKDIQNKLSSTIESTKKELESKGKYWAEKAKDTELYRRTLESKDAIEAKYDAVKTPLEDKNVLVQLVDRYIDLVNHLGSKTETTTPYSTMGPAEEVKDKNFFSGWFKSEDEKFREDLKKKAEAEQKSWANWGSRKVDEAESKVNRTIDQGKDEANKSANYLRNTYENAKDKVSSDAEKLKKEAEEQKQSWSIWGSKKADEAEKAYYDGKDALFAKGEEAKKQAEQAKKQAEQEKNSWFNWGSKKADEAQDSLDRASNDFTKQFEQGKAAAIEQYEKAKTELDSLTKDFLQTNDPHKQAKLDAAKRDVESAFSNLRSYGNDVYKEINQKLRTN